MVPFFDQIRYTLDMREQVVPFPPQGVITEDNLMVSIDSVIYFRVVDPVRAAYEAQDYQAAIEQLTMTTLRNIIGGMDLEARITPARRSTSGCGRSSTRPQASGASRSTGWSCGPSSRRPRSATPWRRARAPSATSAPRSCLRKASASPRSCRQAVIVRRPSSALRATAGAQVLRAQANRQAQMLRAEGEAQAISTVFGAIHAAEPDQALLAYQYMQMMPKLARGDSNKVWIVPSELNDALKGLGQVTNMPEVRDYVSQATKKFEAPEKVDVHAEIEEQAERDRERSNETVEKAIADAQSLEKPAVGRSADRPPRARARCGAAAQLARRDAVRAG